MFSIDGLDELKNFSSLYVIFHSHDLELFDRFFDYILFFFYFSGFFVQRLSESFVSDDVSI